MNTWQQHGSDLRPDAPLDIHQLKPAWPCLDYSKSIIVCKDGEEKPAEKMEQPSSSSSSSIRDERFKYLQGNQSASTGILGHPSERNNRCSTHLEIVTTLNLFLIGTNCFDQENNQRNLLIHQYATIQQVSQLLHYILDHKIILFHILKVVLFTVVFCYGEIAVHLAMENM